MKTARRRPELAAWGLFWCGLWLAHWGYRDGSTIWTQRAMPFGAGLTAFAAMAVSSLPWRRRLAFMVAAFSALFLAAGFEEELFAPERPWWLALAFGGATLFLRGPSLDAAPQ
jgi:hypothetical protein